MIPVNKYGGVAARDRQQHRRERFIAAGFKLFAATGYANTTIVALSEAANCALRTFYEEFGSREALLGEMFDRVMAKVMQDTLDALQAAGNEPRDFVRAGVDAYVASMTADAAAARVVLIEVIGVSRELDKRRRELMKSFVRNLQNVIAPTGRRAVALEDLDIVILALAGATDELVTEWLLSKGRLPLDRLTSVLYDLWLRGLRLDAPRKL